MNSEMFENILVDLSKKSKGKAKELYEFFKLSPDDIEMIFPLTIVQKDMYLESKISSDKSLYNVGIFLEYEGSINLDLYKKARQYYYEKNPIRRSFLVERDGIVFFATPKRPCKDLEYHDLRDKNFSKAELKEFTKSINDGADHLSTKEYIADALIRFEDNRYIVFFSGHHITADGVSATDKVSKVQQYYQEMLDNTFTEGEADLRFLDYVFESDSIFDQKDTVEFWKNKLAGLSGPPIEKALGSDLKKNTTNRLRVSEHDYQLIKDYCWSKKITISFYFKSLFILMLKYYFKSESSFPIYEFIQGRSREYKDATGMFASSIPTILNEEVFKADTIDDIIGYLRKLKKETRKNQYISQSQIDKFVTDKTLTILYNYLPAQSAKLEFLGEEREVTRFDKQSTNDLQLTVEEFETQLNIVLQYNKENFIENRFLERILLVSNQIVEKKIDKIKDLEFIFESEKNIILNEFNHKRNDFPLEKTFAELFEEKVKEVPEKIAVSFNGKNWTYQEINNAANHLAHHLVGRYSIKADDLIGVLMQRSDIMLITILAVFKSGAAYVPLNPDEPEDRVLFIINDANTKLVLTTEDILFDEDDNTITAMAVDTFLNTEITNINNLDIKRSVDDLAYIIYTSGSTGKPKGAMVEQVGMINHLHVKLFDLQLDQNSIIAQNASHCFDISVWQFLAAFLVGGKTVIYSNDLILEPDNFLKEIETDQINILEFVPSYLSLILSQNNKPEFKKFDKLKYLLVTGEELKYDLVENWFQRCPNIPMVNAYGPTEASDDITHCIIKETPNSNEIPVGKPVTNMNVYIVNEDLKLCPVGMKGEICVSGVGVGRGYINKPDITEKVFLEDPYLDEKGVRFYRTGDVGAWREDGNVLFYGRKDYQVKIRGFRIELSEIEKVITEHQSVENVVVIVKEDSSNSKKIIAYIVGQTNPESLREYLTDKLPDYMIPSVFYFMNEFPLTQNGKIDRKSLPDDLSENHKVFVAPRNDLEKSICEIWENVLDIDKVSINDDYFELGGDSIKSIKIVAELEKVNINFEIKDIYELRTVEKLSNFAQSQVNEMFIDQLLLTHYQNSDHINSVEVYSKNVDSNYPNEEIQRAIDLLSKKYLILNSNVTDKGLIQFANQPGVLQLYAEEQRGKSFSEELLKNNIVKKLKELNFGEDLFNIIVYEFSDKKSLSIIFNKLIFDQTSIEIFIKDFNSLLNESTNFNNDSKNYKKMIDNIKDYWKDTEVENEVGSFELGKIIHLKLSNDNKQKISSLDNIALNNHYTYSFVNYLSGEKTEDKSLIAIKERDFRKDELTSEVVEDYIANLSISIPVSINEKEDFVKIINDNFESETDNLNNSITVSCKFNKLELSGFKRISFVQSNIPTSVFITNSDEEEDEILIKMTSDVFSQIEAENLEEQFNSFLSESLSNINQDNVNLLDSIEGDNLDELLKEIEQ